MNRGILLALVASMAANANAVGVGGQCNADSDCTTTNQQSACYRMFTMASCSMGQCQCNSGYSGNTCAATTTKKQHGQSCTQVSDCDTGLTCSNNACACSTSTYTFRSAINMCVDPARKVYGEACTQTSECYNTGGTTTGMTCSTTCQCASGYIHKSGYCVLPLLDEACTTSVGCATLNTIPIGTDGSVQNPSCMNSKCTCPTNSQKRTSTAFSGSSFQYCVTTLTATKGSGVACSAHNECVSKVCAVCPGDTTNTKKCLVVYTSGVTGIQSVSWLVMTLTAVRITMF